MNGAGKSSLLGEHLRQSGGEYYNADEFTHRLVKSNPGLAPIDANAQAWEEGRDRLERAIRDGVDFTFETTLGGRTITRLLEQALERGMRVNLLYVGLQGPDLHIARVAARVARGGHDVPVERIRQRYSESRLNLIRLLPRLSRLRVFDNSAEASPAEGEVPEMLLVLETAGGRVVRSCPLDEVPEWAKPIMAVALRGALSG